jgi:hypothetical protein
MTETEKSTLLIELEKIRIDKYKQTRELEFKVNIALWTLIVLIGYHYRGKLSIEYWEDLLFFIIVAIVIVVGHFFLWLVPISESLARDNAKAYELQEEVEKTIGFNSSIPLRNMNSIKRNYGRWNIFLAGITFLLFVMLGAFFII